MHPVCLQRTIKTGFFLLSLTPFKSVLDVKQNLPDFQKALPKSKPLKNIYMSV